MIQQILTYYFTGFLFGGCLPVIVAVFSAVKRAFALGIPDAD